MIKPKIFIGPMSKNIVDAVIEYSNDNDVPIGLIPSRRQIDYDSGYVNNWKTNSFSRYVKSRTEKVLLVRDHGGPNQGYKLDNGKVSLTTDANCFDVIHVDVWKKYQYYYDGLEQTISLINFMFNLNPKLLFEVGTERSIRETTPGEIDNLLTQLKQNLKPNIFGRIKYCVIQSGTALQGRRNIGEYDHNMLINMVEVVRKHGMISKEHNGDYLTKGLINSKFEAGLDSINVAPEFGGIETSAILDHIYKSKTLVEEFYQLCYQSNKWVKWVPDDYKPEDNKIEIIKISGHYVFSHPKFIEMKNNLRISDDYIKYKIKDRIRDLLDETKT